MSTIRVAIVDDEALIRDGLRRLLDGQAGIDVVAVCDSGEQMLATLERQAVDVCVIDVIMPGIGGLETLARITQGQWDTSVIMLSAHQKGELAVRCLRAGANGFASKHITSEGFVDMIRRVASGDTVVEPALMSGLVTYYMDPAHQPRHERMSNREFMVFLRLAHGETVGAIAESLSLSPKTISTFRQRVLAKLDLHNNAELTVYAVAHGLMEIVPG